MIPNKRTKDKAGNLIPLTQTALMNIDYDTRADKYYKQQDKNQLSSPKIIPHQEIQAYFESNGGINTGKLHEQITRDCHCPKLQKYIIEKYNWNIHQFNSTNSPFVQKTFIQKTFWQKTKISKVVYNQLPTIAGLNKITPTEYPSPFYNTCKKCEET